jgi:hypothetical protein
VWALHAWALELVELAAAHVHHRVSLAADGTAQAEVWSYMQGCCTCPGPSRCTENDPSRRRESSPLVLDSCVLARSSGAWWIDGDEAKTACLVQWASFFDTTLTTTLTTTLAQYLRILCLDHHFQVASFPPLLSS